VSLGVLGVALVFIGKINVLLVFCVVRASLVLGVSLMFIRKINVLLVLSMVSVLGGVLLLVVL
jgi:hypothetical protein